MQRPAPVVILKDVCLTLTSKAGPIDILSDISLEIGAGESVALLGPSGSGKSSLLMVAAGLESASAGEVIVAGTALTHLGEDQLARFRRGTIGIVFQSFHLIETMTALENVAVPLELNGVENAFGRAREELATVGLEKRIDHYPGELSGGEQQRVALARATAARPKVLFADEPTGNLDSATGEEIANLLFSLQTRFKQTLFLVTHEETLARRCGRTIHLRDGRMTADNMRTDVVSGSRNRP